MALWKDRDFIGFKRTLVADMQIVNRIVPEAIQTITLNNVNEDCDTVVVKFQRYIFYEA